MADEEPALTNREVRNRRILFAILTIVGSLLTVSAVAVGIAPSPLMLVPMTSGMLGALLLFWPNRRTVGTAWLLAVLALSACAGLALGALLYGDAASVLWFSVCAGLSLLAVVRAPNAAWREGRATL